MTQLLRNFGRVEVIVDQDFSDSGEDNLIYISDSCSRPFGGMMGDKTFPYITAWSRAFAYLSKEFSGEQAVWFFEEDVAADLQSLVQIVEYTRSIQPDLASLAIHNRSNGGSNWPWWHRADGYFQFEEIARSYNPMCRLSGRLVRKILDFQRDHGHLIFHEVLFSSLARKNSWLCLNWEKEADVKFLFSSFRFRPTVDFPVHGISHPVKNLEVHARISGFGPGCFPRFQAAKFGVWNITHDEYEFLFWFCQIHQIKNVAEFGPGTSTLAFLDAGCEVVSFEHEPKFFEESINKYGRENNLTILKYDLRELPNPEVFETVPDLVFVDSPPATAADECARFRVCEWGLKICGAVAIHDSRRVGEKRIVSYFKDRGMLAVEYWTSKGIALIIDPKGASSLANVKEIGRTSTKC